MFQFQSFFERVSQEPFLRKHLSAISLALDEAKLRIENHKQFNYWWHIVDKMPENSATDLLCDQAAVSFFNVNLPESKQKEVQFLLKKLIPWRKGPFQVFDTYVDAEWRSDYKWARLLPFLPELKHKKILDVGSNNGYYMWRMLDLSPEFVLGVDPSVLFWMQFEALKKLRQSEPLYYLPITLEALPATAGFDCVFSMGILYHRSDPIGHLQQLFYQLVEGGCLILETLVIDGDENQVLVPEKCYAKMRNVWFLPSVKALELWLKRCGFDHIVIIDESFTQLNEQRKTSWINSESLDEFLTENGKQTIEGLPPPKRVILKATKPIKRTN